MSSILRQPPSASGGELRDHVVQLVQDWGRLAHPTREDYLKGAQMLDHLRRQSGGHGLWPEPPLMMTATLDDGWGHGLAVIESLAAAVGVTISPLGLLQPPATILKACREAQPDLLGLTVLQFDSDDALKEITAALPRVTTLVAGGAAFRYDPEFAERTGTHAVAKDGVAFLCFLLAYQPVARTSGMTSCHEA